jgi:HK97 family phage prohead protease
MTVTAERAAEARKVAAEARAAGAQQENYYRSAPGPGVTISAPCGSARSLAFGAEMRATKREWNGKPMYNLLGIASVTDQPYDMYDAFGPYEEIIDHRAFDDTLAADPDVAFLLNHRGMTMARTRAKEGSERTLTLRMVNEGLEADAWLNPKRQDVADLIIATDDGNIDQMSFAFMLEEGWWSEDFSQFKITKLDINRGDVSAVNYGANPYTSIAARSREILDDLVRLPIGAQREAMARLSVPQDPAPVSAPTPASQPVVVDPNGRSVLSLSAWIAAAEDNR